MNKDQPKILIVEDEEAIRSGLTDVLVYHGYRVESVGNGTDGLQQALTGRFALILLDVMLPGMNGFDVCDEIRQSDRHQPIIMLTAKSSDDDIIQGLRLGADDYVSKPFSIAELVLRVEAVIRRTHTTATEADTLSLTSGVDIDVKNLNGRMLDKDIVFTRREMDILCFLAEHTSRPVSRQELLTAVWGYARNLDIETRTVDIHIAKLRRKIEINPKEPNCLVTIRGAGYRLMTKQSGSL